MFREIANMLGIEEATSSTPGWFRMRLAAIKRVFNSMSASEQAELDAEREKMEREGYPEQTKRRYANAVADTDADADVI